MKRLGAPEVRDALDAHVRSDMPALPGRTNHLPAGILVPLVLEDEPACVLTLRSDALREHAGEVSFPGGRPEPGDADIVDTAVRETHEELGVRVLEVLGALSSVPLYTSDYRLVPFVGRIPQPPRTPVSPEVAKVLCVSIAGVLAWPAIDAIAYDIDGIRRLSPVFELEGCLAYGATAHVLLELLAVLAPLLGERVPPLRTGRYEWHHVMRGAMR